MTDLRIFYRFLGIAEHIIEPSHYHLLGIDRKVCNSETVKAALLVRKNELRQNAPGPEFVPHIVQFEKEQLEPAAAVLGDETKRAEYDKVLAARWKHIKDQTVKRSRLIGVVRMAIANAVDEQGAMDSKGRDTLSEKLKELGVEENNVTAILARIPSPLFETGEFGEINADFFAGSVELAADKGKLDEYDKTKLFALADRLNIDKEKATATMEGFSQVEDASVDSVETGGSVELEGDKPVISIEHEVDTLPLEDVQGGDGGDAGKIHLVSNVLKDRYEDNSSGTAANADVAGIVETDETDKSVEVVESPGNASDQTVKEYVPVENQYKMGRSKSLDVVKFVSIVAALLLLCVIIYLLSTRGEPDLDEQEVLPVKISEISEMIPEPIKAESSRETVKIRRDQREVSVDEVSDSDLYRKDEYFADTGVKQVEIHLSEVARDLVVKDFTVLSINELLVDTVVAMAASCDRVSIFAWQSHTWKSELNEMLVSDDSLETIIGRVEFVDSDFDDEVSNQDIATDEDYRQLEKDLSSSVKLTRYNAIERLKIDGSRRAVDLLLGDPADVLSGSKQAISRRLRALRQINEPYIPGELADRIGVCSRASTAQQVSLALVDLTGIVPTGLGILPGKNDQRQRIACSAWWKKTLSNWTPDETLAGEELVDDRLAGEIAVPGKLLAAAAFYCKAVAGELDVLAAGDGDEDGPRADRQKPASAETNTIFVQSDVEAAFVESIESVNVQLRRAIGKAGAGGDFTGMVNVVNVERDRGILLAETRFQEAAVEIETTGRLLEILVAITFPDGRFDNEFENIRSDRRADVERVDNVLQEIRQHAMHNLRLFEMLMERQ